MDTPKLSRVAKIFNGRTPSKNEQRSSGHPVLKIKDVNDQGVFSGSFQSFVDDVFFEKHKGKKIRKGDTLILNAAHSSDYVGSKTFWAEEPVVEAIPTGEWLIVRPDELVLDKSYARHWLQSEETKFKIRQLVKGIHLYPKDMARLKIPLPRLDEQERIAAILDKTDAIRRKRQQAIQLADEFLRSVFLDLFGAPVLNPKKWDVFPLGSLIKTPFQNGAYFPKDRYSAHGVEMVHMSDAFYGVVKRGKLKRVEATKSEIKKYCLTTNDLLISRRSLNYEGSAKPCRIPKSPEPLIFESSLIRINPDTNKIIPEYLYYYLSEPNVRKHYIFKYVSQSTISGINQNALKQIKIITPPLDLQYQFENTLLKIRYKIEKDETLRKEATDLFHSLTQRAFRGEL